METVFLPPPEIRRLVGDRAHFLNYLDYDEEDGTRNYCLDLRQLGYHSDAAWYVVRIDLMDEPGREHVTVAVEAGHRGNAAIGSFELPTAAFPSPISLDPEALRRSMDLVIADRRR